MTDPKITFGPSAAEAIVEAAGWRTDDNSRIVNDSGHDVLAPDGEPVHLAELAGVVTIDGELTPIRDDFNDLVDEVKRRRAAEEDSDPHA